MMRTIYLSVVGCLLLASCSTGGSTSESVDDAQAPTQEAQVAPSSTESPAKVYSWVSPLSFTIDVDGWSYEVEVEAIEGLKFSTVIENFPPGYAGIKVETTGETSGTVVSLDEGRNAPEIGVSEIAYGWFETPQSEEEMIPGLNQYLAEGSCTIYSEGGGVMCLLTNSEWDNEGNQIPGMYTLGSGLIGESGSEVRSPQSQVETLVAHLMEKSPDRISLGLANDQGTLCIINISPDTQSVTSDDFTECSLTQ